jgi:hypothetical protein
MATMINQLLMSGSAAIPSPPISESGDKANNRRQFGRGRVHRRRRGCPSVAEMKRRPACQISLCFNSLSLATRACARLRF